MKNLVLILVAIVGWACQAQVMTDDQILGFCQSQFYGEADKTACFNLAQAHLFDAKAVGLCKSFYGSDDQKGCLGLVADKQYSDAVITFCESKYASSDKLTCIKSARSISLAKAEPVQPNSCSSLQGQLSDVLTAMQNNDFGVAEAIVKQMVQDGKSIH